MPLVLFSPTHGSLVLAPLYPPLITFFSTVLLTKAAIGQWRLSDSFPAKTALLQRLSRQLGRFPSISAFCGCARFSHEHMICICSCSFCSAAQHLPGCKLVPHTPCLLRLSYALHCPNGMAVPDLAQTPPRSGRCHQNGSSSARGESEWRDRGGVPGGPRTRRHLWWSRPTAAWLAVINPPAQLSRYKRPLFGLNIQVIEPLHRTSLLYLSYIHTFSWANCIYLT